MRLLAVVLVALAVRTVDAAPAAHDFIDDAKALLVVGACAEGPAPEAIKPEVFASHCKQVRAAQNDYKKSWLAKATAFFQTIVPKGVKTVVYPFAGGDLSSALTVFPDADEITTLSLEPAGDPRALSKLSMKEVKSSLTVVAKELKSLYRSSYSVTMNMIGAMRGGRLPTQLIFSLSALSIHGYEPVSLKYFKLTKEGEVVYLTDEDLATIDKIKDVGKRNQELSNVELTFKKIGSQRTQIYRHIMANLDDKHLESEPSALAHLTKKGKVTGMTKAASYLMTFGEFSTMRKYIIDNIDWMVSDTTGLPPKYGTPAGFEYEVYGNWEKSNMKAGNDTSSGWHALWKNQPKRPLDFRFGYPEGKHFKGHLVVMRRKK